ncbi:hypothetical protein KKB54_04625 [bacterium]|nr:hypothetical protein [bacterium]MBU0900078.1 hypothetical protein [bacterium]MBU1152742.1 hypothetical protein [bacterium]MBU1782551.1 hypothetical protein [bacterium]MBU2599086.1 hypothetical protein [bacterium]
MEITKNLLKIYQEYNNINQINKDKEDRNKVKDNEKSQEVISLAISKEAIIASENEKASLAEVNNAKKAFGLFKPL